MKLRHELWPIIIAGCLFLSACGSNPNLGQYKGTKPEVSFTLTSSGVQVFLIMFDKCWGIHPLKAGKLESDGSFTIFDPDSFSPAITITGKITGETASGTYSATRTVDFCYDTTGIGSKLSGTWTAKWVNNK
jgi:hypothetical protein